MGIYSLYKDYGNSVVFTACMISRVSVSLAEEWILMDESFMEIKTLWLGVLMYNAILTIILQGDETAKYIKQTIDYYRENFAEGK